MKRERGESVEVKTRASTNGKGKEIAGLEEVIWLLKEKQQLQREKQKVEIEKQRVEKNIKHIKTENQRLRQRLASLSDRNGSPSSERPSSIKIACLSATHWEESPMPELEKP